MKKKIIFITIESVKRELDSKILLALRALKKNYRVVIGQKGGLRELIKDTNPGIMVLKSFGPKNTSHIDFIKKNNFKIVSSDEELILAMDFEDKIEWRMNNENLNKLDLLLAVGETSDFSVFKKNFNSIVKNILVCGNMRLQLLKKNYRKLLERDTDLFNRKFGNYILFLTSFPQINKVREMNEIDWPYSRVVSANIHPDSRQVYLGNEQVLMQREILFETIKFLDNFEKNFPNQNLVISPHPNEKFDFWSNYIKKRKFKKIFINLDTHSSSFPLMNASEMIISLNSTSLLESYFLEKKAINFLGKNTRESEIDLLKKILKVVRSSDELTETIKDLKKNETEKVLCLQFDEIKNSEENFDSFDSILDAFDKLKGVDAHENLFKNNYYLVFSKFRSLKNYIKRVISYALKLNPMIMRFRWVKLGTRLYKKNFIKNVMHINSLEKVENLKIKQVGSEVFLLDSDNKY